MAKKFSPTFLIIMPPIFIIALLMCFIGIYKLSVLYPSFPWKWVTTLLGVIGIVVIIGGVIVMLIGFVRWVKEFIKTHI